MNSLYNRTTYVFGHMFRKYSQYFFISQLSKSLSLELCMSGAAHQPTKFCVSLSKLEK
jgi:hypothetical protein